MTSSPRTNSSGTRATCRSQASALRGRRSLRTLACSSSASAVWDLPAALYLAAAGVGSITLCDGDTVEVTNLQRQIIHAENRVGVAKAQSGFWSCKALNPCVNVKVELRGFTKDNAFDLLSNQTVVLDCTDNVPTRYMLSDACAALAIPLVSAAAVGLEGQLTVYNLHPGHAVLSMRVAQASRGW